MNYEFIKVVHKDHLCIITIDRPDVLNALSPATSFEMAAAFDEFEANQDLWVAIVTGSGQKAFSVGGDISVMVNAEEVEDYVMPESGYGGLTSRVHCYKPIIAAVNGMALGGGFEVALAADIIIAVEGAVFGLPEPKIGAAAVAGGMHRLVRQIGLKPAMGILLTADSVSAQEGYRLGFVNTVVPRDELMSKAVGVAEKIIQCAPLAIQATKQAVMEGLNTSNLDKLQQAQKEGQFDRLETMFKSSDIKEGLTAFMEKRKPNWQAK
ncbi:MAG TPA: enoyl-CoA hydratase [Porticoccaceae bacterium]|nr:enoyl-CoA hydratase-related protein [Porticoccaceae bacterium]HIG66548.1 enoyl-CoA hydratase [Porticoccaceae bacterium]